MDKAVEALVGHGVLGAICILLFYWIWRKEQELNALRTSSAEKLQIVIDRAAAELKAEVTAHMVDVKNFTSTALDLQAQTSTTANRLVDVFDELKRMMPLAQQQEHIAREELRTRPTLSAPRDEPSRVRREQLGLPTDSGRYGGGR